MTDSIMTLREYMDLFEASTTGVLATVTAYVGVKAVQLGTPPFPQQLTFDVDRSLDRNSVTATIKAAIQATTGYEPARFTWRYDHR